MNFSSFTKGILLLDRRLKRLAGKTESTTFATYLCVSDWNEHLLSEVHILRIGWNPTRNVVASWNESFDFRFKIWAVQEDEKSLLTIDTVYALGETKIGQQIAKRG